MDDADADAGLGQTRISRFLVKKPRLTPGFTSQGEPGREGAKRGFSIVFRDVCRAQALSAISHRAALKDELLEVDRQAESKSAT